MPYKRYKEVTFLVTGISIYDEEIQDICYAIEKELMLIGECKARVDVHVTDPILATNSDDPENSPL